MLRYHLLFILYLSLWTSSPAQVALSYCVDLKVETEPAVKLGRDFMATNTAPTCTGYCSAKCDMGILDPIGGFELGYYLYKDKPADTWAIHYQIGDDGNDLMQALNKNHETNRHKLQGGKEGIHLKSIPRNEGLTAMGDELQNLWQQSRQQFLSMRRENVPPGDLARVFSRLEITDQQATLTLDYLINNRVHEIYEAVAEQLFQLFPAYDRQDADDTTSLYIRNREFPSINWTAFPSRGQMELTINVPLDRNAPRLIFDHEQLRPARTGTDTLVSIKLQDGSSAYFVALSDQSELKSFRIGKEEVSLQSIDSTKYAILPTRRDLNLSEVVIRAVDEHGNEVSKPVLLLQHEAEPPKFGLLDPKDNLYRNPGDEVILDKFGQRFELRGKVVDDSPIRSLRINKESVKIDDGSLFSYALRPGDNNQIITVEVVDAHGNKLTDKFRLKYKESGIDRKLNNSKLFVDETFSSNNPSHLLRNKEDGLNLWIQDDRMYLQRLPPADTGTSAEALNSMPNTEHAKDALVPFGFAALDFNSDFEFTVSYKQVEPNSPFFFAFGINDPQNSYYFIYGERDNLFLGQMEAGVMQCYGEGCAQNALNRVYSRYTYLEREPVKPNFFDRGNSVSYTLTVTRYNQFYLGALDDPQDYLFVKIDNGIDEAKELRYKLTGGNSRISGSKCGFGLGMNAYIAVDAFKYRKGDTKEVSAFYDDKDAEKACMPTCFNLEEEKKEAFFDCLGDDYHALIISNGSFGPGLNPLDSATARGRRLYDQLVNEYQFQAENVEFKTNMNKSDFLSTIESKLPKRLTKKDKLLIYIISHGTPDRHIAFTDGQVSSSYLFSQLNEKGAEPKYKCKQILVVIDACYSGEMAPIADEHPLNVNRLVCDAYSTGSRLVLTSSSKAPTKDSELTKAILGKLETHPERFLSIDKLFDQAGEEYNRAMQGTTRPTIKIFDQSGNEPNGSFLFVKKKFYH